MDANTGRTVLVVGGSSNIEFLEKAVCNHGFFMMAPNKWKPSQKSLTRPLSIATYNLTVIASITQPDNGNVIKIHYRAISNTCELDSSRYMINKSLRDQVSRMLRICPRERLQLKEFHCKNPRAENKGFGCIFRSPTPFEDIVKSILLCNCPWARSLEMAQALCDLQHKMRNGLIEKVKSQRLKRKRSADQHTDHNDDDDGNFPSPEELACLDEETLNEHCKLGYRAGHILEIAQGVCNGKIDLQDFELETSSDILFHKLSNIRGFGPFTVANMMMCLGFYQHIPIDTETEKHLQLVHKRTDVNKKNVKAIVAEIYDKYAPYQCLVYWMEHVDYYEKKMGKLSVLPCSEYRNVATNQLRD